MGGGRRERRNGGERRQFDHLLLRQRDIRSPALALVGPFGWATGSSSACPARWPVLIVADRIADSQQHSKDEVSLKGLLSEFEYWGEVGWHWSVNI